MSNSTHCYSAVQLLAMVLVILPATAIRAESPPPASENELQKIEAAWKARTDRIHSLTMRIEAEEFIKGRGDKPLDDKNSPFGEPLPETGRAFKIAIEYVFNRGKAAHNRSGPIIDSEDPEKTSEQTVRYSFDGHEYRWLCEQTGMPAMGYFEKRDAPDAPLLNSADLLGIQIWMQPQELLRRLWEGKAAKTVDDKTVEVDGVSCRRVRFVSKLSGQIATLDLDPRRGWLPLQWQKWSDQQESHPSMSLTVKYGDDAKIGPVVKAWTLTHFDPDGGFKKIRKAKVAEYQINGNVDDSRFTLTFPVGAHVSEKVSETKSHHYIQKAAGLEPVDQRK